MPPAPESISDPCSTVPNMGASFDHRSMTFGIATTGTVAVTAYAALAALQILVLNPIAAAPAGGDLAQIQRDLTAANESLGAPLVLTVLGIGVVLAIALLVLLARLRDATPMAAALAYLLLLILGTPAYFMASFGAGMALAYTYMISGGDHSPWAWLLYWTSALALLSAGLLGAVSLARLQRRKATTPTDPAR